MDRKDTLKADAPKQTLYKKKCLGCQKFYNVYRGSGGAKTFCPDCMKKRYGYS